jgi:hypothetical protein
MAAAATSADRSCASGSIAAMSETGLSLNEQLDEIGARLAWVRDYL